MVKITEKSSVVNMKDKNTIVSVKDMVKEYIMGEVTVRAADRMNFEVCEGEFVVVLGPSGSGKSTLLNIVGAWTDRLPEKL